MPKVTNLSIKLQTGSTGTYYASWNFNQTVNSGTANSAGIKKGSLVTISSGATYYNGVAIPSWVKDRKWNVVQVTGSRAVLGKDQSGSYDIQSPIDVKYLSLAGSSGSSSSQTYDDLDHYEVKWYYHTGDGIWFESSSSDAKENYSIYSSVPENALKIKVKVTPVAKTTRDKDGNEIPNWKGSAESKELKLYNILPPDKPSIPSTSVEDKEANEQIELTVSVENINDEKAHYISFEVHDGVTNKTRTDNIEVRVCRASTVFTLATGGQYRVRCRAYRLYNNKDKVYSEYSDYTGIITTFPSKPTEIVACRATSETSVYIEWKEVPAATSYDIEYAEKESYFDGSDQTTTISGIEFTHHEKSGLESGKQYYFRIRAVNDEGSSAWSDVVASVVLGSAPSAPTTWSSTTTAIVGEPLTLYWVHNSEDGSSQTTADLEIYVDGFKETHTVKNSTNEDEKDKTSSFVVNTSEYTEGTKLEWRVRTKGVLPEYGEWSILRTIDIYAKPNLELTMLDQNGSTIQNVTKFPWYLSAIASPKTQLPLGYHLTVVSNEFYSHTDKIGNAKNVSPGQEIYSKHFDITDALMVEMSAGNVDLENNISYTVTCRASMDSGLTAESSIEFTVNWTDSIYEPTAEIGIDEDIYSASIRPYCIDENGDLIADTILSVYRVEYDGRFTEIATNIRNYMNTYVTDPHPALDYARYRIVAISESNGGVGFYDMPGRPIHCDSIIIQWDETWREFETANSDIREQPTWSGSMLKLPYNVDVSESSSLDRSLVEYAGRSHPVSYYGTQLGETASWSTVIPKSDIETLYGLRRLAKWKGDVYVREPSGVGYWASITLSFNQKHKDPTIPVTFSITRVEGGM